MREYLSILDFGLSARLDLSRFRATPVKPSPARETVLCECDQLLYETLRGFHARRAVRWCRRQSRLSGIVLSDHRSKILLERDVLLSLAFYPR